MTRPRVFITYTGRDLDPTRCGEVAAKALEAAIEAGELEAIRDEMSLQAGDPWRDELDDLLAACDAAVVVVTPAFMASPWARYEVALFMHRFAVCGEFPVIPLYVACTHEVLDRSEPALQRLADQKGFSSPADPVDPAASAATAEIVKRLREKLRTWADADAVRALGIGALLARIDVDLLQDAARTKPLEVTRIVWRGQSRRALLVARAIAERLLSIPLSQVTTVLLALCRYFRPDAASVFQLAARSWLDREVVRSFRSLHGQRQIGALAFLQAGAIDDQNETSSFVVSTCAERAARAAWRVIHLVGVPALDEEAEHAQALLAGVKAWFVQQHGPLSGAKFMRLLALPQAVPLVIYIPEMVGLEVLTRFRELLPGNDAIVVHRGSDGVAEPLHTGREHHIRPLVDFEAALRASLEIDYYLTQIKAEASKP